MSKTRLLLALLCLASLSASAQTAPTMTVTVTQGSKSVTMPDSNTVKATINLTVSALIHLGGGGSPPPPPCTVNVTGNASLQTAITTAGAGGIVCAHGTFTGQGHIVFLNNQTLRGDGAGSTIINGSGAAVQFASGFDDGVTGVTVTGITLEGYGGGGMLVTGNGWTVSNSTIQNSVPAGSNTGCTPDAGGLCGSWGVYVLGGGVTVQNNLIQNNDVGGIGGGPAAPGSVGDINIIGNELGGNNVNHHDSCASAAGLKMLDAGTVTGQHVNVLNNYSHGNFGPGLWVDSSSRALWSIQGNTVIGNNVNYGILWEVSLNLTGSADISHNVVNNNGTGVNDFHCGGSGIAGIAAAGIAVSDAGEVNVHDNNVSQPNTGACGVINGAAIGALASARDSSSHDVTNVRFYNNTVTFTGSNSPVMLFGEANTAFPLRDISGSSSNNNSFYLPSNTTDAHFQWDVGDCTPASFTSYQGSTGQDAGSTIHIGSAAVAGCTMVGCTGSGW